MKKRVYIAVVTLALASLFAGCGKKSADAAVSVKDDVVEFVNEELPAAKADHDNAIGIYNAYFTDTVSLYIHLVCPSFIRKGRNGNAP